MIPLGSNMIWPPGFERRAHHWPYRRPAIKSISTHLDIDWRAVARLAMQIGSISSASQGMGGLDQARSALAGLRRRAESAGTIDTSTASATNQTARDASSRANSTGMRTAVVAASDAEMNRAAA